MIKVTFTDEIEIITSTEHLYQWDVGQVLEIDGLNVGTPTIHFGVKGDATGYAVQSQIVDGKLRCGIPDSVLQSGKQIIAYIYVSAGASKYTDRVILIPVVERNKPNNYRTVNMDEVTETQSFFDSMVDRLTNLEKRVPISFWTGTQEQYDALSVKQNNCFYIITDDDISQTIEDTVKAVAELDVIVQSHEAYIQDQFRLDSSGYYYLPVNKVLSPRDFEFNTPQNIHINADNVITIESRKYNGNNSSVVVVRGTNLEFNTDNIIIQDASQSEQSRTGYTGDIIVKDKDNNNVKITFFHGLVVGAGKV